MGEDNSEAAAKSLMSSISVVRAFWTALGAAAVIVAFNFLDIHSKQVEVMRTLAEHTTELKVIAKSLTEIEKDVDDLIEAEERRSFNFNAPPGR